MVNKSLNEKIRVIGFWTFGGIFWYLLISYFLLSDYPIQDFPFNHKKAYEVIKDALTLAATFLAPVAAFVLFDDWRTSHRLINNESEVLDILKKSKNLAYKVKDIEEYLTGYYHRGLTSSEVESIQNKVSTALSEVLSLSGQINFSKKNFSNTDFHDACIKLNDEQYKLLMDIIMLLDSYTYLEEIKKDPNQHSLYPGIKFQEDKCSNEYYSQAGIFTLNFEKNLSNLDDFADFHRIK